MSMANPAVGSAHPPKNTIVRVLVLGAAKVGKSSLLLRFTQDEFDPDYRPTIGIDFRMATLESPELGTVKTQIWDTAGNERFRTITSNYINGAHGFVLVFDLTEPQTFQACMTQANEIRAELPGKELRFLIVGTHVDAMGCRLLPDNLNLDIERLTENLNCRFVAVSSTFTTGGIKERMTEFILSLAASLHPRPASPTGRVWRLPETVLRPSASVPEDDLAEEASNKLAAELKSIERQIQELEEERRECESQTERELLLHRIIQLGAKEADYRKMYLSLMEGSFRSVGEALSD